MSLEDIMREAAEQHNDKVRRNRMGCLKVTLYMLGIIALLIWIEKVTFQ